MKKSFVAISALSTLVFSGCGGGSSGGSSTPTVEYDMASYIVSAETVTKPFDIYTTDSNYNLIGGSYINVANIIETRTAVDTVKVDEVEYGITTDSNTFTYDNNSIYANGDLVASRFSSINGSFGLCKVSKHYDTFEPVSGYSFSDIIEITCDDDYKIFYKKDLGQVAAHNSSIVFDGSTTTYSYNISVASL